jgi:maleylacetate reductase
MLISTHSQRAVATRLRRQLGAVCVAFVPAVREHVPSEDVVSAERTVDQARADGVVVLGGGSAIGLGKAIATSRSIPLIALPTTYSGSEMTDVFGVTSNGTKHGNKDERARPALVLADPQLTVSMPAGLTAASGMNAVAHAIEALYGPSTDEQATGHARAALELLRTALPVCVSAPDDIEARTMALRGSLLAGAAMSSAGMGFHHRLAHLFGGAFRVSHAGVHAVLLPHTAALAADLHPEPLAIAGAVFGDPVGRSLHAFGERIGTPRSLSELGLSRQDVDAVARQAIDSPPRGLTREGVAVVGAMLHRALAGRPPATIDELATA